MQAQHLIPALDSKNVARQFVPSDYICCEVLELNTQSQLLLGMKGVHERYDDGPPFGLISQLQLPHFYK